MMCRSTLVLVCVAALLLASSTQAEAARRGRRLTAEGPAIASASSVAGPGETVISDSKATSENGQLTVSKVDATGAGPGTVVNCEQEAKSGQIKSKECPGYVAPKPAAGANAAASASATATEWDKAPACKKAAKEYKVEFGKVDKKPWGYEDGKSCALRLADGKAAVASP